MKKQYIHDNWSLRDSSIKSVLPAKVPGCLHTDLISAGIVQDIFYRDNNDKYQWIENCSPVYETVFDAEIAKDVKLKFDGLDTYANVYLNNIHLGETHNMFIPHSFDVSGILKSKDNHLRVEFFSPVKMVEGKTVTPGFAFTGDRINTRRMQCTYSWDWVDRFVTMGIFRPVYLEYREGLEVEDVYVRTDALDRFGAAIVAEYTISGFDKPGIIESEILSPRGEIVYRDAFYADRELMVRKMDISAPELWYPAGYGEQPIYTLRVKTATSSYETRFGIRTLRILNIQDTKGSEYYEKALKDAKNSLAGRDRTKDDNFFGFLVIVNGKEIFCRGGNWVPCDPFPSEESEEKIRTLVAAAKSMGANMLRVWGGGLFEKECFFDECDIQGILVCHDFLMACARYPEKEEWFINELRKESEYAVKYMRNHPSLAWFHGDNENAIEGSDILSDYTGRSSAMNGIFPSIYGYSKHIPFLASSPWGGNTFSSITAGTSHNTNFLGEIFDYVYHSDCNDYKEYFSQFTSRFVSEEPTFGAICRESMLEFMTEEDLLGENEEILKFHSKTNPGLPVHIYDDIRAFTRHVLGEFVDGEDRYFKMKYIQCEWVRITKELVLRNLGYSNGIIYWMFNDCWPASVGWAFVDYYTRRKPSYYSFKRLSVPVIASFEVDGSELVVSNTSDSEKDVIVKVYTLDKRNGFETVSYLEREITLGAYSKVTMNTSEMYFEGSMLIVDVESGAQTYRSYFKKGNLHIRRSNDFEISDYSDGTLTIEAKTYLQAVELEGDFNFSDNYFTMMKGEKRTISYESFGDSNGVVKVNTYTIL